MDWAQDPELKEIFEKELRERSERLARYSRALANRALPESKYEDAKRDAHTIKGNASVMGHRKVSDAMAVVEDVWTEFYLRLSRSYHTTPPPPGWQVLSGLKNNPLRFRY